MKRFILYVAIMFGSLIAQAQPAVEFHDVTAAITDSVRIVPNFSLGDTRSYLVTSTNRYNDQFDESHSAEYRFTVESVDQDYYGIFFFLDKMQYEMPENIPTTQAKMLLDMFHDKGFRFLINRNDLTVDSIFYTEFLDPFKVYLTTAFREMFADKMEPEQMEREIEEGLNDDFLKRTVTELMQAMITPFTEQYGRTLPLGEGQWIEDVVDEDTIVVDDLELPEDSVEYFDDWVTPLIWSRKRGPTQRAKKSMLTCSLNSMLLWSKQPPMYKGMKKPMTQKSSPAQRMNSTVTRNYLIRTCKKSTTRPQPVAKTAQSSTPKP